MVGEDIREITSSSFYHFSSGTVTRDSLFFEATSFPDMDFPVPQIILVSSIKCCVMGNN